MTPSLDGLLSRFRTWRRDRGLSLSAMAVQAGLSRAALLGMDREDWSPSGETIRALEGLLARPAEAGEHPAAPAAIEAEQATSTAGAGDAS